MESQGQISLNINKWEAGVYLIKAFGENGNVIGTQKLIKQ